MHALIAIAILAVADPTPPAAADARPAPAAPAAVEGSAVKDQPAPPSAADSVVAAAFGKTIGTPADDLKGERAPAPTPPSGPDWTSLAAPALAILGLGALAFGLTRRRRAIGGNIHIVESAGLGPKRSLVIADVLGERLVLAVSEAGVTVLATRPAPPREAEPFTVDDLPPAQRTIPKMGFLARLMGKTPAPVRFDELLGESLEDQELRAKLAAGMKGFVP
jgi:flagellar biogenesis protein FliO